ncbi:MAG: 2-amino-4-hydroxy-6-hydroxymethyldihydropteridine diphosphokinase [Solirubrobacterales bacterium]|nr:2-amino-4-hydroxy-6-hydroxymethyldihydropteridine diphosphokinase [Solirubrobacterales bacterium]
MPRAVYLGLGSNIGDRFGHLSGAIERMAEKGLEVEATSSVWETEPVGEILDQPDFLNAAVRVRTDLEPEPLLDLLKEIETDHGRDIGRVRHAPRELDIDLLLVEGLEYESGRLRLPHREVATRRFVLAPLLELDPELCLPDGRRLADALEALPEGQSVRRIGPLKA